MRCHSTYFKGRRQRLSAVYGFGYKNNNGEDGPHTNHDRHYLSTYAPHNFDLARRYDGTPSVGLPPDRLNC